MQTEYPLPGILKWFPVKSSETFNVRAVIALRTHFVAQFA